VLNDVGARKTVAQDRIEMLRRDFLAPRRRLRVALGLRLVRLGARLAGEPAVGLRLRVYTGSGSRLRSSACR
jgi:hypothetical protein